MTLPMTPAGFGTKMATLMQWMYEQASPADKAKMARDLDAQFDKFYGKPIQPGTTVEPDEPSGVLPPKHIAVPAALLHSLAGPSPSAQAKKRAFELWMQHVAMPVPVEVAEARGAA